MKLLVTDPFSAGNWRTVGCVAGHSRGRFTMENIHDCVKKKKETAAFFFGGGGGEGGGVGEREWLGGESTLPTLMWHAFVYWRRHHMSFPFVVCSLPCSERNFSNQIPVRYGTHGHLQFYLAATTQTSESVSPI